ncbi:hypothetical protein K435DRAFT_804752 [Dendrothele bispora CBS 962.96]|uniref:Uncharacterized protein n=1 Tax=Dendrothele bispora (strain CBS 962.96) TaxID=1314807 RepID=A0A4S8LDD3_DENBC|nr:hypothetical protein K435DRAFT_804752 [Dendrothele bispora CBS 962.96]
MNQKASTLSSNFGFKYTTNGAAALKIPNDGQGCYITIPIVYILLFMTVLYRIFEYILLAHLCYVVLDVSDMHGKMNKMYGGTGEYSVIFEHYPDAIFLMLMARNQQRKLKEKKIDENTGSSYSYSWSGGFEETNHQYRRHAIREMGSKFSLCAESYSRSSYIVVRLSSAQGKHKKLKLDSAQLYPGSLNSGSSLDRLHTANIRMIGASAQHARGFWKVEQICFLITSGNRERLSEQVEGKLTYLSENSCNSW